MALSSKHVGILISNEVEVLTILEALHLFVPHYFDMVTGEQLGECNLLGFFESSSPRRLQFYMNEIKLLSCQFQMDFKHVGRSVNAFVDSLAIQGVVRSSFVAFSL